MLASPSVRGQWFVRLHLHERFRHDHELAMLVRDVKVVDVVRKVVAIAEHAAARRNRKMEGEAALHLRRNAGACAFP